MKLKTDRRLHALIKIYLRFLQGEENRDLYDAECLQLINEYFYGVRIFPGQDPTHVYIGKRGLLIHVGLLIHIHVT